MASCGEVQLHEPAVWEWPHGCTELLIVHSCAQLHTAAQGCTELHTASHAAQSCTWLYRAANCCTQLYRVAHGCTELHTAAQSCTRCTELHRVAHCTELHTAAHGYTELLMAAQCTPESQPMLTWPHAFPERENASAVRKRLSHSPLSVRLGPGSAEAGEAHMASWLCLQPLVRVLQAFVGFYLGQGA